jgi:outer membrane usher protein FimD/PapC
MVALLAALPLHAQQAAAAISAGQEAPTSQPPGESNQDVQFDMEILRERGLSPAISNYFRSAPRFIPGAQPVQVSVNGNPLGRKQALFGARGELCFTAEFVRLIGLRPIAPIPASPEVCPDYRSVSPRAVVQLQPSLSAVDIVVPPEEVITVPRAVRTDSGGLGALLNYRANVQQTRPSGGAPGNRYQSLNTTLGFNAGDWILRSEQYYTGSSTRGITSNQMRWGTAYLQKTFEDQRQVLQVGRITSQNPLFAAIPIVGAQWFPEGALWTQQASFPITGVASTRAQVEIRQNNMLLYTTVVPPGPFAISDYPLQNRGADLQVRVIEATGIEQAFTVPAASLLLATRGSLEEGWNITGGQLWDQTYNHTYRNVPVLIASRGFAPTSLPWLSGTAGGLISSRYTSLGIAMNTQFIERGVSLFGQMLASSDTARSLNGTQMNLAGNVQISKNLMLGLSGSLRTAGYRQLQEAVAYAQPATLIPSGYRTQIGANLNWNAGALGGISTSVVREIYFQGDPGDSITLGWNKPWRGFTVNVGLAHRKSRLAPMNIQNPQAGLIQVPSSNYAYINLTVPLGVNTNSRTFIESNDKVTRMGTSLDQRVNEFFGYRLAVQAGDGGQGAGSLGNSRTSTVSAYATPLYTSLSLGFSHSHSYESYYGEASGSVVGTGDGVALSPYVGQDSFATVRTGNVTGARVETPQGPVWSGLNGLAAIPALPPYRESRIEVSGRTLPLTVDINNGLQVVQVSRGAVLKLDAGMKRVQRLMLTVRLPDGTFLPAGSTVLRGDEFFTAASAGGKVLVTGLDPGDVLSIELADGRRCTISSIQAAPATGDHVFEAASARCNWSQ